MKRLVALLTVSTTACLGLVALAGPSFATFPGKNGLIAFSTGADGSDPSLTGQIFTVQPNGSGLRQLTHVPKGQHAVNPSFSPDGKRILFQSDVSGTFQIWVMSADGSGGTQLIADPNFQDVHPRWSPDGKKVVFSRCTNPFGVQECVIAVASVSGGRMIALTGGHWVDGDPEFSPDGSKIAFDSNRGGLLSAVWVMNANGSSMRRLTAAKLQAFWPDWSPNGTNIAFQTNCCVAGSNVWVMGANGSRPHALTHVPFPHNAGFPSYSPNGKMIVLQSDIRLKTDVCCGDVYVMNANGSNMHLVVASKTTLFTDWGPAS